MLALLPLGRLGLKGLGFGAEGFGAEGVDLELKGFGFRAEGLGFRDEGSVLIPSTASWRVPLKVTVVVLLL